MISPLKNTFLVSINKEADSKIVLSNGLELIIDKEFGEQSTTQSQESELYNYFRELESEYSRVYDEWVIACKKNFPTVVALKRRLLQIEGEQKKHKVNKIIKPFSNAIQHGIIRQIPRKVDARVQKYDNAGRMYYDGYFYDTELCIGDKVYFHHFVSQPENEIEVDGEVLYKAEYNQIMCVVRGEEIIPLEKWILASPVVESEEDTYVDVGGTKIYTKLSPEKKYMLSKVEYSSPQAKKSNILKDQVIIHPLYSEYKLKIEGKDMYRMHIDDIYCEAVGL